LSERTQSEPDLLLADAARLQAHPAFTDALRKYTHGMIGFRKSNRLINKMISYHARWRVALYLLYLHADRERFGPDGGATYGNLLEMCGRRPEVSARSLKTMLALLQMSGFVRTIRNRRDGRGKIYQPTDRMNGFLGPWLSYATQTLDMLQPEERRERMLLDDPTFVDRLLISTGRAHANAIPLVERMPEFTAFFGGRDGAGAIQLAVMLADMNGQPLASRADLGKRFGLSKTQVTTVFHLGQNLGYFELDADGVPTATPYLRASFRRWVSIELAFYATHMQPCSSAAGPVSDQTGP
jgi:DNA-binding PadR family transcriptional regulator